ncbi:hypothetical protein EYW49_02265 [Siculibacillus lacustris]|uniref:Uncharacterized protein n=1 Tax=Siculibacillus lacustris TaxID=1549641 RepID=A0A4Q9VXI9_9HYPH|nr:hypothetical protein [Siculibacillus lacustris]TBW41001.1 hypothetical protein EYW49_02265 [Siculibacillus lacustris]
MGDVLAFPPLPRPRTSRGAPPLAGAMGEVVFFTGVRIERWTALPPDRHDEPPGVVPPNPRRKHRRRAL